MRTRILITVGLLVLVLGLGWSIGQQAGSTLPSFNPGQILTADDLNTIVEQVDSNSTALSGHANAAPIQVDCDGGGSLAQVVQQALPGHTIQVSGTCAEQVTVTTDRMTLDGQGVVMDFICLIVPGSRWKAIPRSVQSAMGETASGPSAMLRSSTYHPAPVSAHFSWRTTRLGYISTYSARSIG